MAALGANTTRKITPSGKAGSVMSMGVKASAVCYKGSAAGDSSGAARALVAADAFLGFFDQEATGGGSDGSVRANIIAEGYVVLSAITGLSGGYDDIGVTVYMSSDNDFTSSSSGNSAIGKVVNYDATNGYTVFFQAAGLRSI